VVRPNRALHLTQPRKCFVMLTALSCTLAAFPAAQVSLMLVGGDRQ
jgi:hypothetical protein